ncbi:MAG: pilin [bacterium]
MIKELTKLRESELGFTLIEVMVVIIMVGILAAIAVPIYSNYVYRARTSEGVTTLGAIKTYMVERSNATGKWPNQAQLNDEFKNFRELYYFNNPIIKPTTVATAAANALVPITTTSHIAIEMTVDATNFGQSGETLQIDIDVEDSVAGSQNNGWSGGVREKWAKHLPSITENGGTAIP